MQFIARHISTNVLYCNQFKGNTPNRFRAGLVMTKVGDDPNGAYYSRSKPL